MAGSAAAAAGRVVGFRAPPARAAAEPAGAAPAAAHAVDAVRRSRRATGAAAGRAV